MFLIWFDDSKMAACDKIAGGIAAYRERFKTAPEQVLVNESDLAIVQGIRVECAAYVRANNFWIGPLVEEGRK